MSKELVGLVAVVMAVVAAVGFMVIPSNAPRSLGEG
jgi:hypothetical protein